jgi:hypothetical protein
VDRGAGVRRAVRQERRVRGARQGLGRERMWVCRRMGLCRWLRERRRRMPPMVAGGAGRAVEGWDGAVRRGVAGVAAARRAGAAVVGGGRGR